MNKNIKIGISVVAALAILFFGIEFLKGVNVFKSVNYYHASYTDVMGLEVSAPVTVNGFKVGQVRSVEYEYDNPGHVLVEMSLNKDLRVPVGTKAVIVTDMLGTATVRLDMAQSADYHRVGDRLEGVTQAGMMDALSNDLLPAATRVLPTVDTLLNNVNDLVTDPALAASIARLEAISASLQSTLATVDRAVKPLPGIVQGVGNMVNNLDTVSANVALLSQQLANSDIEGTMANVNALSARLRQVSDALASDSSSVGMLLNDPSLYNNLTAAAASLDSLLIDVKAHPKRYISIKLL